MLGHKYFYITQVRTNTASLPSPPEHFPKKVLT